MSRNRYTSSVRSAQRVEVERLATDVARIAATLRLPGVDVTAPCPLDGVKERRRARLERRGLDKTERTAKSATPGQFACGRVLGAATTTEGRRQMNKNTRTVKALVGAVLVGLVLAGCGGVSAGGPLGQDRKVLASCPSKHPAAMVELDGTGSSADKTITAGRMAAVESIVRRTAVCSGRLRVIVFASSSADTATLFDGSLVLPGATDNARLRRVPAKVDQVMAAVRAGYGPAVKRIYQGGSDITAQYRLAAEWVAQVGGGSRLELTILTDGFQNVNGLVLGRPLTKAQASALAARVPVPKLPGASVTVAGLGRVAGRPPASTVADGLVAFYDALCHKTGAAGCVSVTDYSPDGQ